MVDPAIPPRLNDAKLALRALSAARIPSQQIALSASSALDELELALKLDDELLAAARAVRAIADGQVLELDNRTQAQAGRLADLIADLAS